MVGNFHSQLSDSGEWRTRLVGLNFTGIRERDASDLEVLFTMEDMYSALCDMNGYKAPRLDGFTTTFWQSCWETVKEDTMRMFGDFYQSRKFMRSLNDTFFVMIPTKGGQEFLGWVF